MILFWRVMPHQFLPGKNSILKNNLPGAQPIVKKHHLVDK